MNQKISLKKVLKPIHIWAIAVGLVISGEYFGWNLGWAEAGTIGFLFSTAIATLMYITFIFSFTELSASLPHAGGPFAYSIKALGPFAGWVSGYATLIEFLFAPPAIAFALGSYVHFLYPSMPVTETAIASYFVFSIIHFAGIKESATFTLFVTILAVGELLLYMGLVAPAFEWKIFTQDPIPNGFSGVMASLPFAIWFYLAIEGVAMVSEEVIDPQKNIPKGYILGIITLVLLAVGVMVLTGGITHWKHFSTIDYPLPEALSIVMGKDNQWTKFFAGIGLFGLIASFHGTILGYSRQIFALARSGYLPKKLAHIHPKFKTPDIALLTGGIVGIVSLLTGTTQDVILMSVMGALVMYIISMLALFSYRVKFQQEINYFKTPFYPWLPLIALFLSTVALCTIIYYNFILFIYFLAGLAITSLIYWIKKPEIRLTIETE